MTALWFSLISLMLATYVVLDGFDFGAGILHLLVARDDEQRRTVLAAIGPVWDGNEVWLLASGGVLVFAFPRAYAAGFSGFYLPLMMSIWLLVLRGISIEFRSHQSNPLWRQFWDATFALSSAIMALILGVALGNVVRGVPLDASGYFAGPLFTDFRPGPRPGVLDWYTVLVGLFAVAALAGHGALYLVWKTTGPVQARARALAGRIWALAAVLVASTTWATWRVQPRLYVNLADRPWTWALALLIVAGLVGVFLAPRRGGELLAFLCSALFLAALLAATAAGLYPRVLTSTLDPRFDLTADNATAGAAGLATGLVWWSLSMVLATLYFTYLFRSFRGKVGTGGAGHGY